MYNDNSLPNYYLILGLTNDSSEFEIKNQYRKLAKQYHPDRNKNSSEDKMAQINENSNLRKELIENGQERLKEFSWDQSAQKTWVVIDSFLSN